jgi:transcriptional regulator with XRE-family HTH domain
MNIYERIKNRRKELGLSVEYVAEALKVNRATVYRYESSDIEKLPTSILLSLSKVLQTTPTYLMGLEDNTEILSKDEKRLLDNFNKLNKFGKKEALKRVNELTEIAKYTEDKSYLEPLAAHDKDGNFTEEDYKRDMEVISNDDLWNE